MDTAPLLLLLEHLEDSIDELEENLEPLLSAALSTTTQKLPLLDKAKLYVLVVYTIESLLFSYLRLNGVKAKDHPVYKELTRVKQYFEKIKLAEESPAKPRANLSLNKQAAGRVIKHALAGNAKHDLERAEREAKEKLMAKRRSQTLDHKPETQPDPKTDQTPMDESPESSNGPEHGELEETITPPDVPKPHVNQPSGGGKKRNRDKTRGIPNLSKVGKRAKKRKRRQQDHDDQKSKKKKKKGKVKNKEERSPPADRRWT